MLTQSVRLCDTKKGLHEDLRLLEEDTPSVSCCRRQKSAADSGRSGTTRRALENFHRNTAQRVACNRQDHLEARNPDLEAHSCGVQVTLSTDGKLTEALHIGNDTTHKIQPDLPACCRKGALQLFCALESEPGPYESPMSINSATTTGTFESPRWRG